MAARPYVRRHDAIPEAPNPPATASEKSNGITRGHPRRRVLEFGRSLDPCALPQEPARKLSLGANLPPRQPSSRFLSRRAATC